MTISSGTPIPKNERELSIRIAEAIPKAIETNTGANAFGKACLTIALKLVYPNDLAACTNSNSLKRKKFRSCKTSDSCPRGQTNNGHN